MLRTIIFIFIIFILSFLSCKKNDYIKYDDGKVKFHKLDKNLLAVGNFWEYELWDTISIPNYKKVYTKHIIDSVNVVKKDGELFFLHKQVFQNKDSVFFFLSKSSNPIEVYIKPSSIDVLEDNFQYNKMSRSGSCIPRGKSATIEDEFSFKINVNNIDLNAYKISYFPDTSCSTCYNRVGIIFKRQGSELIYAKGVGAVSYISKYCPETSTQEHRQSIFNLKSYLIK